MSRRAIVLVGSFALTLLLVLMACVGDEPAVSSGGPSGSEASTSDEASSDAADSSAAVDGSLDAAMLTFCETLAQDAGTACEDFERGDAAAHGWVPDVRGGGTIDIAPIADGAHGASTIARAHLPDHLSDAGTASARFTQTVTTPGTTNAWVMEADVRLTTRGAGNLALFTFGYDGMIVNGLVALDLTDTTLGAIIATASDGGELEGAKFTIPDNKWVHLTMRIARAQAMTELTAALDGIVVSTISNLGLPAATHPLAFGLLTSATTGATTLEVDNFSLSLE